MKTQIIQLESHDDVISACDKMGWSQTNRILLVLPEKTRIFNRRLDLVLLARHSRSLGAQLALVTSDPQIKCHAHEVGIPVFRAPREAQEVHWRMPLHSRSRNLRRRPPPDLVALRERIVRRQASGMKNRILNWVAFFCSLLALLALTAVLLPGATIELVPRTQVQELTLAVKASDKFTDLNLAGNLPARWTTIVVEGRSAITTTGTITVPVAPASGSVQFRNLTEETFIIPAGTLVSTLDADPIYFATTQEGKVAAGIGKTVLIPVQAVQPGEAGNLPAGEIQAVSGAQGLQLSVINLQPTRYGLDKPAPAPTSLDRERLYNQLLTDLRQSAWRELQERYAGSPLEKGLVILPSLRFSSILEKTYYPSDDTPAEQLQLNLRLEFKALAVLPQDLQNLVTPLLDASLPEGFTILPDTLTLTALNQPILDEENVAHWRLQAQRKIQAIIDPQKVAQSVRGLPVEQAPLFLKERLPVEKMPLISAFPSWWRYMPFLPLRIRVRLEK